MNQQWTRVLALAFFAFALGACSRELPTAAPTSSLAGRAAAAAAVESRSSEPEDARIFTAAGDIRTAVGQFRDALGTLNANTPGSQAGGRREINWDAVPAAFTDTNTFPADFFNQPVVGRARGLVSTTPGTGERVSDVNFADLDPEFAHEFVFFSPIRTFAPIGSNRLTVTFFVPGSSTPALSTGFGVVFSDVDHRGSASIHLFDASGASLGRVIAPAAPGGLSFVGVMFAKARVARVEITSGEAAIDSGVADISVLGRGDDDDDKGEDRDRPSARAPQARDRDEHRRGRDLVIMDDFIYGEPLAAKSGVEGDTQSALR
jgi:hypothetical protein